MNKDNTQFYCFNQELDLYLGCDKQCEACAKHDTPQPEDNKTPERDFFKENNNVEWNEQGEPLYTAKQVEDFIKAGKTPENSEKGEMEEQIEDLQCRCKAATDYVHELENRNKELERLLGEEYKETAAKYYRHGFSIEGLKTKETYIPAIDYAERMWQQYKSQNPKAFKPKA